MSAHTAGPWSLAPARTLVNVKGPDGQQIAQLPMKRYSGACPNAARIVACVKVVIVREDLLPTGWLDAGRIGLAELRAIHAHIVAGQLAASPAARCAATRSATAGSPDLQHLKHTG